jgi:mannose-6-phosphate isomerase-like protein (cupin superfamily)
VTPAPVVRAASGFTPLVPGVTLADLLDDTHGCHGLHQRRFSVRAAELTGVVRERGEAWYVIGGTGDLTVTGYAQPVRLRAGTAVWLGRAAVYRVTGDDLAVLVVTVCAGQAPELRLRAVTLDECVPEYTDDREFRVLLSAGLTITQFVGLIPPGRAPQHLHSYDEVIYVLAGQGVVHLAGGDTGIATGSSIYLPPYQPHCLENTGAAALRVLGVFFPAGSPADKQT